MSGNEPPRPAYAWGQQARHMGQLARGDTRWEVYIEIVMDDLGQVRGRVHFTQGDRHRESAWIFLERTDRDVQTRFNEFSAVELWNLLEALSP